MEKDGGALLGPAENLRVKLASECIFWFHMSADWLISGKEELT